MLRLNKHSSGFTLVELLVVVGIITLLIAVLLPVLARVREHANRIKCAANLHSIGQAMTMYTQQYGYYPGCAANSAAGPYAVWPVRLRLFMNGGQDVFHCPSQEERCRWVKGAFPATPADTATQAHAAFGYDIGEAVLGEKSYFSYGYNAGGTSSRPGFQKGLGLIVNAPPAPNYAAMRELKASRVKVPSKMIAIADTVADGHADFMISPWPAEPGPTDQATPGKVHSGGSNVLFCDGHVDWHAQNYLTHVQPLIWSDHVTFEVRRMWNADNWASESDP